MSDLTDLAFSSALKQAQLVRTKAISPQELATLYLNRIEKLNPSLGSYFTVTRDLALATAQAQTEQLATVNPEAVTSFFGGAHCDKRSQSCCRSAVDLWLPSPEGANCPLR